jgi:glycosyltransferase involved in cell wall biosynthesis
MQVAGAEVLVAEIIRRLGRRIEPVVFCLDGIGELGRRMQSEGVEVMTLDRRPGVDLACARRLRRALKTRQTQLLHAHQYTPFFYSALATTGVNTRLVFTEHGRHFPDVVSARRRWSNKLLLGKAPNRITSVCEFSARALSALDGFRADRIEVIENGIDIERYGRAADVDAERRRLGLPAGRRLVACIARFHPVKDHRMLLDAFADVARADTTADLLLVGDGPLRSDLEQQAARLGIESRVLFFGVRHDVPAILSAVDAFVLASVSEAASITLLEAMASALPVVVTEVGGNPEIVRKGVDGMLTPRGSSRDMAQALLSILADPGRASEMGRNGAARVSAVYTLDRTIDRYRALYEQLCGSAAGSA